MLGVHPSVLELMCAAEVIVADPAWKSDLLKGHVHLSTCRIAPGDGAPVHPCHGISSFVRSREQVRQRDHLRPDTEAGQGGGDRSDALSDVIHLTCHSQRSAVSIQQKTISISAVQEWIRRVEFSEFIQSRDLQFGLSIGKGLPAAAGPEQRCDG